MRSDVERRRGCEVVAPGFAQFRLASTLDYGFAMNNTKQPEAISLETLSTVRGGFGDAGWTGMIGSMFGGSSGGSTGGTSGGTTGGTAAPSTPAPSAPSGGGLGSTSMGIGAQNLMGSFSGAGKIN
jgi:hypothetical protein